jgi:hypothetical protein
VAEHAGAAPGEAGLIVSPWALRGTVPALGRTPALRGFPGGIGVAGPGWPGGLAEEDQAVHEPRPGAADDTATPAGSGTGLDVPVNGAVGALPRLARPGRGNGAGRSDPGGSAWQQALSVWRRAGLEWQRPAGWAVADADLQRTEPIPVVPATEMAPATAAPATEMAPATAAPATGIAPVTAAPVPEQPPGPDDGARTAGPEPAGTAGGSGGDGPPPGIAEPGPAGVVLAPRSAPGAVDGRFRTGRGVLVGAVVCVAVIALAVSAIVITGLGTGGGQPSPLTVTSRSAVLADGQFAGPGGSAWPAVPPTLTGIAAVGNTVVAIGARATPPATQPLVLTSTDGGQTWQRDVLKLPGGPTAGAGAVPLMVAGGPGRWLALAAGASWISADGRTWRPGPAIAPVAAGDRVQALAPTATGFVAAGGNAHLQGTEVMRSPVLWWTGDGRTWQREGAAQLRLPSGKGRVAELHWLAANGSAVMVAGDVARPVTIRRGGRRVSVITQSVKVWLTTNGGRSWVKADPPVSNGATTGLAGLAAAGPGLVAIRPGHTTGGAPDAVAYVTAHGAAWRYAGKLRARRGGFVPATVSGSDDGVVVTGPAGPRRVAFVSRHGWSWRQTADLAGSPAARVTGVTVGPHGNVVAAGAGSQPFLRLARTHQTPVGRATLAAAAAAGVGVNGLVASQRGEVAVGEAGREPAIWLQPAGGQWTKLTITAPASWQGDGPGLTSVVRGNAGWLAVGTEGDPGSAAPLASTGLLVVHAITGRTLPLLLTSADGRSWHAPPGPGPAAPPTVMLTGAAAGPAGYVVVGLQSNGGQPVPALFWSADLRTWRAAGEWTGSPPASQPVSAPLAVAAGPAGFVAAGGIGNRPAVWLSPTGQGWVTRPLALPRGARGAVLQQVAVQGGRIAALGTEARGSGPVPFAAVSADGGRTWHEYPLPAPHPAAVTALAAAGRGFAATGTMAAPTGQDVIIWWSADGRTWQLARLSGRGLSGPGAHAITGLAGLAGQITGVGYADTPAGWHLVLWHARIG